MAKEDDLRVAVTRGKLDNVQRLLEEGVSPNIECLEGVTLLHESIIADNVDMARLLLKHGAHVNAKTNEEETPLHLAAENGKKPMMVLLVDDYGADTDIKGDDGFTALHIASQKGFTEIVDYLANDAKANPYLTSDDGSTALDVATRPEVRDILAAARSREVILRKPRKITPILTREELEKLTRLASVARETLKKNPGENRAQKKQAGKKRKSPGFS